MWIYILLYVLVLNTSQATGQVSVNSTQMYYVKLMIEESAIGNITELLKPFVSNTNLQVDNLEKTTICQNVSSGINCTCQPNYKWSNEVYKLKENRCGNQMCIFSNEPSPMCVSSTSVTVTGFIVLTGKTYLECLAENSSPEFEACNDKLLKKMKAVYSTLRGFDTLTINKYRVGSIIGDFEVNLAYNISTQELNEKTEELIKSLNASFMLETSGVAQLTMPDNPVFYNSKSTLTCSVREDLGTEPEWRLKREDEVFKITNGTEATVTPGDLQTTIGLENTTELWAGEYSCIYKQEFPSLTISHKASAVMDVALLPKIDISMTPSFPHCKGNDLVAVIVRCEIESDSENYTVTWSKVNITAKLEPQQPTSPTEATAITHISCDKSAQTPQLTCTYKNRRHQTRSATITVNIIGEKDKFCRAEGDWEVTKAGYTAVLKCKGETGQRQRNCSRDETWEPEVSFCVNRNVKNVLEKANIVDIGRGSLDENAANVFSLLQNVTNKTETINSFPNVKTSVEILQVLSLKEQLAPNTSTANDFLESSSNLLEKSLTQSWKPTDNTSLAEDYLIAVEQLIFKSNLSGVNNKNNVQVAEQNCSRESKCNNTVFDVSINLQSSDAGSVKMTGFQELDKLLPNRDEKFEANSIVVSTTTENKQPELEITIDFKLRNSRRRNVQIRCVSWDNNTSSWSTKGCKWSGPRNEGQCICSHLSSFAVLMSKVPLEVHGLTVITYTGLSVSVVSLIITLVIEVVVWSAVVRTNSLYLRHTAHINICLCLLVADCTFLASSKPKDLSQIWCKTFVVLKHFCYLSMFFWMLCLSLTLLHQAVFLFHAVSKKTYLKFSIALGYVCPLLIVSITVLTSVSTSTSGDANAGALAKNWYNNETCWLSYNGFMKGTIHAFVIPVGIIVFINIFSMLVVIMKLLDHPTNADAASDKDKRAALTVMRTVVLLTPVFGVTWVFGFAVMVLDLTDGLIVYAVHYAFTLLNAFQGLFILLTTCLGDKPTREALRRRLKHSAPTSTTDSTTKLDSTSKK